MFGKQGLSDIPPQGGRSSHLTVGMSRLPLTRRRGEKNVREQSAGHRPVTSRNCLHRAAGTGRAPAPSTGHPLRAIGNPPGAVTFGTVVYGTSGSRAAWDLSARPHALHASAAREDSASVATAHGRGQRVHRMRFLRSRRHVKRGCRVIKLVGLSRGLAGR